MKKKERLIELRKNLGLTQDQIAKKIRVTRSYYSLLETGEKEIVSKTLARLKEYLNVNPEWIETGKGDMLLEKQPSTNNDSERDVATRWLIDRFSQLPENLQKDLLHFAENLLESTKTGDRKNF
ncbi:MAG: helix-turn-helix domain-containing protein [Planctomycetia bacterium]|nr:helix-turn-helix domain-containing protein [Planctomycetia bacterium]